jgi:hypothetical protein
MGHTRTYSTKINLAAMSPRPDLASTGYCLAQPGRQYLIYVPLSNNGSVFDLFNGKEKVTVDLPPSSETLHIEWFNPKTGETIAAGTTRGGGRQTFTAPFRGDAVLYLTIQAASEMVSVNWTPQGPTGRFLIMTCFGRKCLVEIY